MHLRPATFDDAALLLVWRNDPVTRQNFRSTAIVPLADHIAWLKKSLAMPTRKIYIAEEDGTPVGVVRADLHDGVQELDYTIAPEARGRGIGKMMVLQFVAEVLPGSTLLAGIKRGNTASEKIAQALGLSRTEPESPDDTSPNPVILWR